MMPNDPSTGLGDRFHDPFPEFGTEYFQETNTIKLFDDCSYYNQVATTPEQFPGCFKALCKRRSHHVGRGDRTSGDLAAENATAGLSSTISFPTRQRVCPPNRKSGN